MKPARAAVLCLIAAACGGSGSKANPTAPDPSHVLSGQTVNVVDGTPLSDVDIQLGGGSARADANGNFQLPVSGDGPYAAAITGAPVVQRRTTLTPQTNGPARISLIPASFDLGAFDEMFRATNHRLQRWASQPSVVVVASVMRYGSTATDRFTARSEQMTQAEIDTLISHLNEGLSLLTGGTYSSFASVEIERPQAGQQVIVQRTGKIVIGRYVGIGDDTGEPIIGYGNWAERTDGTVVGGTIWLDRDFDKNETARRLLRIHELGHALGYSHVARRRSVMNAALGPEPTDFDRAGAVIAFQRPIGNVAPDSDPSAGMAPAGTAQVSEGGTSWTKPIR
ncbi:MAG: hypothetical protein HOQ29_07970 [Acidobacteria bacterium]|nr:hypothetical protein [Acidobacteriota bacterium]